MTIRKASLFAASTAIFSLLAGLDAKLLHANHLNFTLYNESSQSIYHLYVAAARTNSWGSDILNNPLRSGEYTRITFPNQNSDSPCIYDIKAVLADRSEKQGRFNLCEQDSVTVR